MDRKEAVNKLSTGDIKVVFSADLVMFLRPTESPTVFLQQLGRGLGASFSNNSNDVTIVKTKAIVREML